MVHIWFAMQLIFITNSAETAPYNLTQQRLEPPRTYYSLRLVKLKLKSQSLLAKSASLAWELGLAMLQSTKYSPLTPLTCGWSAKKHVVAAPCTTMFNEEINYFWNLQCTWFINIFCETWISTCWIVLVMNIRPRTLRKPVSSQIISKLMSENPHKFTLLVKYVVK